MTEPFPIQKMSRLPTWPGIGIHIAAVLAIGLGVWFGVWLVIIPVIVVALSAWYLHTRIRCPQCSRRLRSRSVDLDERGWKQQYFYDCPDCQVTWDPDCVTESD
jgi:hypothetical protein